MILSDVFERFAQDAPLSVMAQGIMENALNPQFLDQLFEDVAEKQFTHKLLFSTIVDLMSVVVCRIRPSIHAAFQARAETVGATSGKPGRGRAYRLRPNWTRTSIPPGSR